MKNASSKCSLNAFNACNFTGERIIISHYLIVLSSICWPHCCLPVCCSYWVPNQRAQFFFVCIYVCGCMYVCVCLSPMQSAYICNCVFGFAIRKIRRKFENSIRSNCFHPLPITASTHSRTCKHTCAFHFSDYCHCCLSCCCCHRAMGIIALRFRLIAGHCATIGSHSLRCWGKSGEGAMRCGVLWWECRLWHPHIMSVCLIAVSWLRSDCNCD